MSLTSLKLDKNSSELAHVLRSFASTLATSRKPSDAQKLLPIVLEFATRVDLKRAAIADRCQVSEATISRWASGRVGPHTIVAKVALEVIRDLALEKALEYVKGVEPKFGRVKTINR